MNNLNAKMKITGVKYGRGILIKHNLDYILLRGLLADLVMLNNIGD